MAESKPTPEIVNAALDPDERIQYRSLVDFLLQGKFFNAQQQAKYDAYKAKIEAYMKEQENPTGPPDDEETDDHGLPREVGIPAALRVRRRYTLSPEALEQRRAAANSPAHADAMEGNRNGWKHGRYAKDFAHKLKPCKSTCPQYPCSLVDEGEVEPGDDCLDKVEVLTFYRAVHEAIANNNVEKFNDLAALQISNAMLVLSNLMEDILRDGTVLKREKKTKYGTDIEYVTHPSLLALPKLLADLGLNPAEFMATPRAKTRADDSDKDRDTIADGFTRVAKAMSKVKSSRLKGQANAGDDE